MHLVGVDRFTYEVVTVLLRTTTGSRRYSILTIYVNGASRSSGGTAVSQRPCACEYHDSAQDDCIQHAVEQHAPLVLRRHSEVPEDHQPDENVVDGERFIDHVAR